MFDGCWSDRSLDKAEKQSRRVSKDFYPSPLKCHWALWSEPSFLCVLRTWWTSFTRFRKRISTHTHTQNLSVCLLWLSLWCAWGQLQNCTILPWHMLPYTLISMQTDAHSTFTVLHSREKLSNLIYCPWLWIVWHRQSYSSYLLDSVWEGVTLLDEFLCPKIRIKYSI